MNNIYFFLVLLIAFTFLTTTTVTAVPTLEKRGCESFTVTYPAGGESYKNSSRQNVTVQIGSSGIYTISTVVLYDGDNIGSSLFGGEVPVRGKNEVAVTFNLWASNAPGYFYYTVDGYYSPTSSCQAKSNSFYIE